MGNVFSWNVYFVVVSWTRAWAFRIYALEHTNRRRYFIRNTMSVMRTNRRQCRCCFRHHHNHRGDQSSSSKELKRWVEAVRVTEWGRAWEKMSKHVYENDVSQRELQLKNEIDMNNNFMWILALMYRRVFLIMRIVVLFFSPSISPPSATLSFSSPLLLSLFLAHSLGVCSCHHLFIIYTRHAIEICHEIKGCTHCIHT